MTMATNERPSLRRRRGLLAGVAATVLLGGVGAAFVLGGGAGSDESDLPVLPSIEEREPQAFDEGGCLEAAPETGGCDVSAEQLDDIAAGAAGDQFRILSGFQGPRYTTDLTRAAVVVLEDTVADAPAADGTWAAQGLARNELAEAALDVSVSARLLDAAGAELAVVEEPVIVDDLRSGEPTPFVLGSEVPAAEVAAVEWWAAAGSTSAPEAVEPARSGQITTYFVEPAGDRDPVEVLDHVDPAGSKPHLVYGSVAGVEGADVTEPSIVAAWLGADGRVLAVEDERLVRLGAGGVLESLDATGLGDFLLVQDGPTASELLDAELALWVVGS
jgi:hypothetical protein